MHKTIILQILLIFALGAVFVPQQLYGKIFKYVDKNGRTCFVDDEGKIPLECLENSTVYQDRFDGLSEQERLKILAGEAELAREHEESLTRAEEALQKEDEPAALGKDLKSLETEVMIIGNQVLVPVVLGYGGREIKARLLLDTGASIIALHKEIADKLYFGNSKKIVMQGAGGNLIHTALVQLNYIKVGPVKKSDLYAGIIERKGPDVKHGGLLGMNFLRGLDYSIDFDQKTVKWKPKQ